jgi:hypothetical protein
MLARCSLALLAVAVGALFIVSAAQADTGEIIEPQHNPGTAADGWQAGTCTTDTPQCSPATESQFYRTAAGHPPVGFTQYTIQHEESTGKVEPAGITIPTSPIKEPEANRDIKTLRVDLPPGLTVNAEATPRCSLAEFENKVGEFTVPLCKESTKVGREEVTLVTTVGGVPAPNPPFPPSNTLPKGTVIPPSEATGTKIPVYNLEPKAGEPALFGFVAAGKEVVFLETEVSWEKDFHESFTIRLPESAPPVATLKSRLVNFGQEAGNLGLLKEGNGTFITNPTTCFDPEEASTAHLYSTYFRAESFAVEDPLFPNGSTTVESPLPEGIRQSGCPKVPFDPSIELEPGTTEVDSPASPTVVTEMPFEVPSGGEHEIGQSHQRSARVTMPAGMGLNPSGSVGLAACTDAEFQKGERTPENSCPAESRIGMAEITTPVLSKPLTGAIYVGEQKSSDPTSGEEFRILFEAKALDLGIVVRLMGNVSANPITGQLTATFDEQEVSPLFGALPEGLPQAPFEAVVLTFDGSHQILTTPPTCSTSTTTAVEEPWSTPASTTEPSDSFTLTSTPAAGNCPSTLGARPFTPTYTAASSNTQGGAYSPFAVHLGRGDGQQEVKLVDVSLPPGHAAKVAGVPYCSEAALVAAAASSGKAELASPSCPSASKIGTASTESGTGAKPAKLAGSAYLAGPYKGAPLSLAVITPAVSGPFDLGTVVVRIALNVDPETTVVHAVSDVIPDVYGGTKLDIRAIDINLDRPEFMHNPTNCDAKAVTGVLHGGGSDPTNPAAFSSYPFSSPYQTTGCDKLAFKPTLTTKLLGGRGAAKRLAHPRIQATLKERQGDANVARTALTLPPGMQLDNAHIGTLCTRPQLAADECPASSAYGHASAKSPLLNGELGGDVYLVPSNSGGLPDLLVDLRGQIDVRLRGVVSASKNAGMRTVFTGTPDAPVSRFTLTMDGGKKGLLVNSKDFCKVRKPGSVLNIKGQNGKQIKRQKKNKLPLQISGCPKKKH